MTNEEQMLIGAVRYALGRRSYIVGVTAEFVASIKPKLSQQCIDVIIRDIEEGVETYHRLGRTLGAESDERTWVWLSKFLKGESHEPVFPEEIRKSMMEHFTKVE